MNLYIYTCSQSKFYLFFVAVLKSIWQFILLLLLVVVLVTAEVEV